uniref:Uncharacterized protein n=1 Tax=Phocoena sinus TaxID=42100 RepID=A0A8C9AZ91_PHOSS
MKFKFFRTVFPHPQPRWANLSLLFLRPHSGGRLRRPRQAFFPVSCLTGSGSSEGENFSSGIIQGAGQLRAPYSEWPEGGWLFRGHYMKSHSVGSLWRVM